MGPFEVVNMVGKVSVKLNLPREWSRLHNVFHVHLVKPYFKRADANPVENGPYLQRHCNGWTENPCLK
jgi:hypothetical protein